MAEDSDPLNLTDEELLEVRKFALDKAVVVSGRLDPGHIGVVPAAMAIERYLIFGDAENKL